MSERVRFFKSGMMLTAVALAMRTVAMFFGAFVSRTVGAEGVGLYTIVMTVYSFAITFATSGISLTVTRLVASAIGENKSDEVGRILKGALIYSFSFGIAATLFLLFGADFLAINVLSDERTITSLRVLAASLLPAALSSVFSGYFVGVKRVGFNAAVQVFGQLVKILTTVILVTLAAPYGLVASVSALCVGITLTEGFAFLLIFLEFLYDRRKNTSPKKQKSKAEIASVAKMAIPLALSAYVRSILLSVEHVLIPKRLKDRGESSSEAYAHYGVLHGMAVPLVLYPMSPLSSFSGLLVPEFAEGLAAGNKRRMNRIASEAMNATLTYACVCAVFLYIFAEELGYVIYDSYEAGHYIAMLAPIIPVMYLDHVTDSMLKGIGEQVYSMWVNISDSLLSVFLVWALIPKLGITGYALVIVIMEGYNFLLSILRLRKKIKFSINLKASVILPLVCSLAVAYITKRLFPFSGSTAPALWLFLKILFAAAILVFALTLLKLRNQLKRTI